MRKSYLPGALLTAALAVCLPAFAGEAVPIDQLDATVTEAIKGKFTDAELLSAERETENGKTKHEVKIRHEGAIWEVEVAENGQITEMEREDENR